jgi:plastocyanin
MEPEEQPVKKSNSSLLFGGLIVVGLIAVFVVMGGNKKPQVESINTQVQSQTQTEVQATPSGPVKEFTVDGTNYAFSPATITAKKGDTVKITFKDDDGRHNLVIDGYNVSTEIIGPGNISSVTFVADKAGSFKYFCSVANHEALGMTGTLVVQ